MASVNPYRYAGYRFDSAIWMYYLNARYYNPSIMRFITQDPLGGMNVYVYASDNPMNLTDPSGMMDDPVPSEGAGFAPETGAMGPAGGATEESPAKVSPAEMVAPEDPQVMYEVTQQEMRSAEQRIQQASRNEGTEQGVVPYEVGRYSDLKNRSVPNDGIEIHHAAQRNPAQQVVDGYEGYTGPSIALPRGEHRLIPTLRGVFSGSLDLLAKDAWDLRNFTSAPNAAIRQLINLNREMFPNSFTK